MQMGNVLGVRVEALYSSEVKFGYEKYNARFLYLIDGEKYKLNQVFERTDPVGLCRGTVVRRLLNHFSNTWDEVLRPAVSGQPRNETDKAKRDAKLARKRRRNLAAIQAAKDKKAYFERQKSYHAEIG